MREQECAAGQNEKFACKQQASYLHKRWIACLIPSVCGRSFVSAVVIVSDRKRCTMFGGEVSMDAHSSSASKRRGPARGRNARDGSASASSLCVLLKHSLRRRAIGWALHRRGATRFWLTLQEVR